jgi:hypothetical protein
MTTKRCHPTWSEEARAAFERHIAAHGGFGAWEALRVIEFEPREVGDFLLALKGLGANVFFTTTRRRTREGAPSRVRVWLPYRYVLEWRRDFSAP